MHHSPAGLPVITILQKTFMIIGFILFIIFGIATASIAGTHEAARDAANPQPELQVLSKLSQ